MAFTEFCCRSGGSNMNGGALASNGEPSTAPVYSFTNGGWNSATGVYTPTSGAPNATVTVGDFASVFIDGATTPVFIARVTAVSSTTVTMSTTVKGGTAPTTAGTGISINVGGAWLGPNGAVGFPYNFATGPMVNAAGDFTRVNFKNDQTYNITAAIANTLIGPITWQGYAATFGDGGKATFDGGTSGASYVLYTATSNAVDRNMYVDLIWQNNGATGSAVGIDVGGDPRSSLLRVVVNNIRGNGFNGVTHAAECEAYACNQSNTASQGGFNCGNSCVIQRCISHDNAGTNSNGFYSQGSAPLWIDCVADSNGGSGFLTNNITAGKLVSCDAYNNTGDGYKNLTTGIQVRIESCNFVANGGFGINVPANSMGVLFNNAFGDNVSGAKSGTGRMVETGTVTYGVGVRPWVDAPNGDFRINLAAAKNTGRGNFTQTAASYGGAIAYPDIGAAQHQDTGGASGPVAQLKSFGRGAQY